MKIKLSTFEVVQKTKGNIEYVSIFKETPEGLFMVNVERDSEKETVIETKRIGNFFLRLVKEDRNNTDNKHDLRVKYWFNVYYIHPKKGNIVKSSKQFYYIRGEKLTKKIEERLPLNQAILEFTNSKFLEYFEMYIRELIKKETKDDSHLLVNNEEITGQVKDYIIGFLDIIHGEENRYIESSFDYSIINDRLFYDTFMIYDNQNLFLHHYYHKQEYLKINGIPYEKIGFVEPCTSKQPAYLYIHLPSLKKLREKERFAKEITTQRLNIGLRNLNLIVSSDGRNTINLKNRNGDISMNLTRLSIDKLKVLYMEAQQDNNPRNPIDLTAPNIEVDENIQEDIIQKEEKKTTPVIYNPNNSYKREKNSQLANKKPINRKIKNLIKLPNGKCIIEYEEQKIVYNPETKTYEVQEDTLSKYNFVDKVITTNIKQKIFLCTPNGEYITDFGSHSIIEDENYLKILHDNNNNN